MAGSLFRNILTVGGWTLMSRGAGFARDVMMAASLGTVAEALLVALSLPNMFRRFFAEGAFNMAFVPMFAKKLKADRAGAGFGRDALSARFGPSPAAKHRLPNFRLSSFLEEGQGQGLSPPSPTKATA